MNQRHDESTEWFLHNLHWLSNWLTFTRQVMPLVPIGYQIFHNVWSKNYLIGKAQHQTEILMSCVFGQYHPHPPIMPGFKQLMGRLPTERDQVSIYYTRWMVETKDMMAEFAQGDFFSECKIYIPHLKYTITDSSGLEVIERPK